MENEMNNQSTEIVIIRHGESLANKERIMIGQSDYDLSDRGREQAAATAEFLKNEHFDAIYSSDLCRAYNTALPNAKLRGLEIITDEGLLVFINPMLSRCAFTEYSPGIRRSPSKLK